MILQIISLFCLFCATALAWPDPKLRTKGQIWPQPQNIQYLHAVRQAAKKVVVTKNIDCDILDKALKRYEKMLGLTFEMASSRSLLYGFANEDPLTSLHVDVAETDCPGYPSLGVDESYTLDANTTNVYIKANQVWGALRGLESFSQLFFYKGNDQFFQTAIISNDYPRFPHRGLLLDTSRHFYSMKVIKAIIELMAMNKLNVFHWHLVDMEAFPYVSKVYPEFGQGAYGSNHTYTSAQVKEIIDFARLHGIRVLPELDTPGHVASWGRALPFMTSRCFDKTGKEMSDLDRGMLDVSNKKMWSALVALFKELMSLFPDKYFHLGGDETDFWMENCWMNNANITTFMKVGELKTAGL
ncbi:unnamed protein product, partial [Mesorhabditis belari]|uniref:beta-N-acetylhexosaminidase n=1 Tax=Mesorhabditis belari TaxID=2138241 RepID=A0AAF3EUR8_9BILA